MGSCGDETESYLRSLSREIKGDDNIHIYFRKRSVDIHNFDVLFGMPGELQTFDCKDEGDTTGISVVLPLRMLNTINRGCWQRFLFLSFPSREKRTSASSVGHILQNFECLQRLILFAKIQWYKICFIFCKHITTNVDDLCITRKDLSDATSK
jgi:hypothetical protein